MVKQRRTFFVDDILHMVMPKDTDNKSDEEPDRKRKRSLTSEDDERETEIRTDDDESVTKKIRLFDQEHENDDSKHSPLVDVLGDGGADDESSISDETSSVGNNSGNYQSRTHYF